MRKPWRSFFKYLTELQSKLIVKLWTLFRKCSNFNRKKSDEEKRQRSSHQITRRDIICSITFMGDTYALEISNILESIVMSGVATAN